MSKKLKILILSGPPASGKSFFAKEFVKGKKDWVIVNRDSIREGTGEYWVPEREDYISKIEYNSIKSAIESGLNVVIDATNLNPRTISKWEDLAALVDAEIEYKKFYIPYAEAIKRDANRERPVGEKVLKRFYKMYFREEYEAEFIKIEDRYIKSQDSLKPKVVICDLDGTLCLMDGRSPYDLTKVSTDKLNTPVYELLCQLQSQGNKIIFVSGREKTEQCEKDTRAWISLHCPKLEYWYLYMRTEKDYRGDEIIKKEIYNTYIKDQYYISCILDDRKKVVDMWRSLGLLTCQVYDGDF